MVPTGAGIFSPHFLQRIVKLHCRLSGILNTIASMGEQKAKIQLCKSKTRGRLIDKRPELNELTRQRLISRHLFWQYGTKVDRTAMQIASSPTLCIAAGLPQAGC
jgi:hypothetical protein